MIDVREALQSLIKSSLTGSARNMEVLASSQAILESLIEISEVIGLAYKNDGTLFVCGNGGSAADAQHLVAELVSKLSRDRTPIRAFALTVDTSILTAIGNDYGYDLSFHRQVKGLMRSNDVLLAITTSGQSTNILKALEACRDIHATSILLTGRDGGKAKTLADFAVIAPGEHTAQIQEAHLAIYHTLCLLIEKNLIRQGICQYIEER